MTVLQKGKEQPEHRIYYVPGRWQIGAPGKCTWCIFWGGGTLGYPHKAEPQ